MSLRTRVINTNFQRRRLKIMCTKVQAAIKIQALFRGLESRKLNTTISPPMQSVLLARSEAFSVPNRISAAFFWKDAAASLILIRRLD